MSDACYPRVLERTSSAAGRIREVSPVPHPSEQNSNAELAELGVALRSHRVAVLPRGAVDLGALTRLAPDFTQTALELRVPALRPEWLVEELAAMVITETLCPSAPREDVVGLIDAAGEALASAAPSCLVLRDASAWLRTDGGRSLTRWLEVADATAFLIEAERDVAEALGFPALVVAEADVARREAGAATRTREVLDALDAGVRAVLDAICAVPTRMPLRWLSACFDGADVGARLLVLMRHGLIQCKWFGADLVVDAPERTRAALDAQEALSVEKRLLKAIARSAGDEVSELGETATFERSRFLARHRALLRHTHDRLGEQRASVVLPMLAAMEPLGTLGTLLDESARSLEPSVPAMTRAALELRRATFLRASGEGAEAIERLRAASKELTQLPSLVAGRFANALEMLLTPETKHADVHHEASALRARLDLADSLERGLDARSRASLHWRSGAPSEAFACIIDAIASYPSTGFESAQLELLQYAMACALAAWTPGDTRALELAGELQRAARRVERLDVEVRARGLMGCALLDAGNVEQAVAELSFAVVKLAASGHHQFERWHRVHRAFAYAENGQRVEAARDFEDFIAMSDLLGGSPVVGVLGGALVGSPAALELLAHVVVPACFAWEAEVIRATLEMPPEESAEWVHSRVSSRVSESVPGFYAFEARALGRLIASPSPRAPVDAALRRLRVAADGSWFEAADGARVSIAKARTLRRVLVGLTEAQRRGRSLTVQEIFALGWPGERAATSSMANRVHVTVSRLRAMGLRDWITYRASGWTLGLPAELVDLWR